MTLAEIDHEISLLEPAEVNFRNVQVLASLYTIRNNYGGKMTGDNLPIMSGSQFYDKISGKSVKDTLNVINELMEAVYTISPKLYNAAIDRL